jgi:hypothetical protein
MSAHQRARRRSHRRPTPYSLGDEPFHLWLPLPDDPLVVTDFGEVAALAFELQELPVTREALVLLDELRRVTAVLLDPPPPLGVFIGRIAVPGLEVPFSQTISIALVDHVVDEPPSSSERDGYYALRRMHMLQGLHLLDLVLVDNDRLRSMAIACDPDAVWFEPFEPLEPLEPLDPPGDPTAADAA